MKIRVEGKGPFQIARTLTDEKITRPSVYVACAAALRWQARLLFQDFTETFDV
jgi:hypothetical protein